MSSGLEERMARLEAEIAIIKTLAITRNDITQMLEYMSRIDGNVAAMRDDVASLKRDVTSIDHRLDRVESNVSTLHEEVSQLKRGES